MKEENILKTSVFSIISIIVILVILGYVRLISYKIVLIITIVLIFGSILMFFFYHNRLSTDYIKAKKELKKIKTEEAIKIAKRIMRDNPDYYITLITEKTFLSTIGQAGTELYVVNGYDYWNPNNKYVILINALHPDKYSILLNPSLEEVKERMNEMAEKPIIYEPTTEIIQTPEGTRREIIRKVINPYLLKEKEIKEKKEKLEGM